jgi:hypothetical protein
MKPFRSFTKLLATASGAIALLAASAVGAQTITNVAQASWSAGGTDFSATSNAVSFAVTQIPATLQTFSRSPSSSQSLPYTPALCNGAPIQLPGDSGPGQGTIGANPTGEIRPGETLIIRMNAPSANLSPNSIDRVDYVITSPAGDRETLTVFETAPDSGVFVAAIATHLVPPQPTQGDCRLGVSAGGLAGHNDGTLLAKEHDARFDAFGKYGSVGSGSSAVKRGE